MGVNLPTFKGQLIDFTLFCIHHHNSSQGALASHDIFSDFVVTAPSALSAQAAPDATLTTSVMTCLGETSDLMLFIIFNSTALSLAGCGPFLIMLASSTCPFGLCHYAEMEIPRQFCPLPPALKWRSPAWLAGCKSSPFVHTSSVEILLKAYSQTASNRQLKCL